MAGPVAGDEQAGRVVDARDCGAAAVPLAAVLVVRGGPGGPGWSWWSGTVTRWSGLSWRVTAAWSPPPGPGAVPGRERFVLQDVVPAPESPANNDILAYKAAVAALRTAVAGPGGRQSR